MEKLLVAIFNGENQAEAASRALGELHSESAIVLYAVDTITKDTDESVIAKHVPDPFRIDATLCLAARSLIQLLGGPPCGRAYAFRNSDLDLARLGTGPMFLEEVRLNFLPGTAGVVAEIDEDRVTPVNARIKQLGGRVFRGPRSEALSDRIKQDVATLERKYEILIAQISKSTDGTRLELLRDIESCQVELSAALDSAKCLAEELRREGEAKIVFLQEQAAIADGNPRMKLEKKISAVRMDYTKRTRQLTELSLLTGQQVSVKSILMAGYMHQ